MVPNKKSDDIGPFFVISISRLKISILIIAAILSISLPIHDSRIPEPTRDPNNLTVGGWTFPWDRPTLDSLDSWVGVIDEVSPYWYWVFEDGTIGPTHNETEDGDVMDFLRVNDIDLIPMISNNHDVETIEAIINDPAVQEEHITNLLDTAETNGFRGFDINYENIPTELKDGYSDFIDNITDAFHDRGLLIYVSVFPKVSDDENREGPGAYDYRSIGPKADMVRVMSYNLHWSSSPKAGPITSHEWMRDVYDYASESIPSEKISMGVAQFGYDWVVGRDHNTLEIAENVSFGDVKEICRYYNVTIQWNGSSRTPYIDFRDELGRKREVHFTDSESMLHQMEIIKEYRVGSISLWKLGNEDPLSSFYAGLIKSEGLENLPPFVRIPGDLEGMRGTLIDFGPVRAYDPDGYLVNIEWELGDGNISKLMDATHTYQRGGFYNATFKVVDNEGFSLNLSRMVRIGPRSHFSVIGTVSVGEDLCFDGDGCWDPVGIVSYSWDMGDGSYRFHSGPEVNHSYERPGKYEVSLTVINTDGFSDTWSRSIIIPDEFPPEALLPERIVTWEGSPIMLDGSLSRDDSGELNYTWILPGGDTAYGPRYEAIFDEPGSYLFKLQVRDPSGKVDNNQTLLVVRDRTPPQIDVDYIRSIPLGREILIDASKSVDNVGIVNFTWNLGGGNIIFDSRSIIVKPGDPGRYHITLDIVDGEGNWNSTTVIFDVYDALPPEIEYKIDPAPGSVNDTYAREIGLASTILEDVDGVLISNTTYIFSVSSMYDSSNIGWINWSFGDGHHAGGQIVYHSYLHPGLYQMNLGVEDIWGNREEKSLRFLVVNGWNRSLNEIPTYEDIHINNTVENPDAQPRKEIFDPVSVSLITLAVIITVTALVEIVNRARILLMERIRGFSGGGFEDD